MCHEEMIGGTITVVSSMVVRAWFSRLWTVSDVCWLCEADSDVCWLCEADEIAFKESHGRVSRRKATVV